MRKMTNLLLIGLLIGFTISTVAGQQKKKPVSKPVNLLAGKVKANGLPTGWQKIVEGSGRVEWQSGTIYFERDFNDDKCIIKYSAKQPNGKYSVKISFKADGNNPQIFFNNKKISKVNEIRVTGGTLTFYLTVKNEKVWGNFTKITLEKR